MTSTEKVMYMIETFVLVDRDITLIAKSKYFNTFYHTFLTDMYQRDMKNPPFTKHKFIKLFEQPLDTWGYFTSEEINRLEEDGVPRDLSIIDGDYGLNEEINEILIQKKSLKEQRSGPIVKGLIYCINQLDNGDTRLDWHKQYEKFRHFLVENSVSEVNRRNRLMNSLDTRLQEFIVDCYESIPTEAKYICPNCGWTVEQKEKGKLQCVKKECKSHFNTLSLKPIPSRYNIRLKDTIQLTTVIPTMAEFDFYHLVKNEIPTVEVEWYPNIERLGDLLVLMEKKEFYIDIKDYGRSSALANELIRNIGKVKTKYIVIPDKRNKHNHASRHINEVLKQNNIHKFKVYSFSQMIDQIKKETEV